MRLRKASEFLAPNEHAIFNRDDLYVPSDTHGHEFVELEYVLAGEGVQIVNGKEYRIKRGDVITLEVGSQHSYRSDNKMEILNCIMEPRFYSKIKEEITRSLPGTVGFLPEFMTLSGKHFVEVENLLFSMEQEFKQKQLCYRQMLDNHVYSLLITLFRNAQEQISNRDDHQLKRHFVEYVEKNYTHCTLQNTALFFGYSTSHFSRLFKKVIGQNFSDYVSHRRLEEATDLLMNTAFSIDTICHQLGYKDRTQFHKLFQKQIGMTPTQYRKRNVPLSK